VASLLKKENRRVGEPFKQTVNRCLRIALTSSQPKPFKVTPIDLELPEDINQDKTSAILEALEGPLHR